VPFRLILLRVELDASCLKSPLRSVIAIPHTRPVIIMWYWAAREYLGLVTVVPFTPRPS